MLSPVEAFWLQWQAAAPDTPPALIRHAKILLLAHSGAPPEAIAGALGITAAEAELSLTRFAEGGLADFPRPALTLDEALAAARVDMAHAGHVAALALALFDQTRPVHRLPPGLRRVLHAAALLHNAGVEIDEPRHHTAGRDLLLGLKLRGFTEWQQRVIACAVRFHRKRVKPQSEPTFAALSTSRRRQTLALSALLRVADGLDYSQTQTTGLLGVLIAPDGVTLRLDGPNAAADAARARKKADLWVDTFHTRLDTLTQPDPTATLAALAAPAPAPDTPLAAVAVRAIAAQLVRWQESEAAAIAGDPQAVKAVRGAARRLRMALVIFGDCFKGKRSRRLQRGLRRAEEVFGEVRDLDVLMADAAAYQTEEARDAALPVLAAWQKERQQAQAAAALWLGSPEAHVLQAQAAQFVFEPPLRPKGNLPLQTGLPPLLRALVASVAERQAAIEPDEPKTYHRLRQAVKLLRYALEFGQEAMPQAGPVLADLITFQSHLGQINDDVTLSRRLTEFLDGWSEQQARRKRPQLHGAESVLQYANARRDRWQTRLAPLKKAWPPVRAARLRQRLGLTRKP